MTAPPTPGVEVERFSPVGAVRTADSMLSDDEMRRTYRIAEALWKSGAYRDVKSAETAFAKMVIGRDLGLSPAQSMSGIHLVEGGVQMHYAMLGQFVRARPGYDYRPGWIKKDPLVIDLGDRAPTEQEVARMEAGIPVVVWHDEEEADDFRQITGAVVDFSVDGKRRGISRFTMDDARQAQLIKDSAKAAWNAAPRNMLMARAMSNGVKWYVPEVLGGLPVYVEGELDGSDRKSLTAPTADGGDEGQGVDLGPDVEKIIARATEQGHRGLSNRAALELALGGRDPGTVRDWVVRAKEELVRHAAEKEGGSPEDPGERGEGSAEPVSSRESSLEGAPEAAQTVDGEAVEERGDSDDDRR